MKKNKDNIIFDTYIVIVVMISIIFIVFAARNIEIINEIENKTKPISKYFVYFTNKIGLTNMDVNDTKAFQYLKMRKEICICLIVLSVITILQSFFSRQFTLITFPLQVIIYIIFENASIF